MHLSSIALLKSFRTEIKIFLIFLSTAIIITLLHLFFHPVRVLGMDTSIFYMDEKYTLAAFFSVVTAFLVGYISLTTFFEDKFSLSKITNIIYGCFFIVLAIDEYFEIHEYTNTLIKANLNVEGVVQYLSNLSWIFPLSLIIAAVFILLVLKIKFTDSVARKPIFIGMICFFTVLIFELLGSSTYGQDIYVYFIAVEEGLEMIGTTFFLLAGLIENKKSISSKYV